MRRISCLLLSSTAALGLMVACGSDARKQTTITVFAASSLTGAFTEMGTAFSAERGDAKVAFNFAGSGDLVTQIINGAPADVFASADESNMDKLVTAKETVGTPVPIAKNTMEIIVEKGNPKGIIGVADLANPDLIVVLCAITVPCGQNAATILSNAQVSLTVKSLEDKVKGVVTKVAAGEADAGIVFVTDVLAAGKTAGGVMIPADINVISTYPVVITKASAQASTNAGTSQAFVDFVAGPKGQAILAKYGFLVP